MQIGEIWNVICLQLLRIRKYINLYYTTKEIKIKKICTDYINIMSKLIGRKINPYLKHIMWYFF